MQSRSDFRLRSPATEAEWEAYYDLRWRILRAPWQQPRGSERDDREGDGVHVAFWHTTGAPVAIGRIHLNSPTEAQVRYMAVDPSHARRGLGGQILRELERRARQLGAKRMVLNAREEAQPFYESHSYEVTGPAPMLFGQIPHSRMEKSIT